MSAAMRDEELRRFVGLKSLEISTKELSDNGLSRLVGLTSLDLGHCATATISNGGSVDSSI